MEKLYYIAAELPIDRKETIFFKLVFDGFGFVEPEAGGKYYNSLEAAKADFMKHCTPQTAQQFNTRKAIFSITEEIYN